MNTRNILILLSALLISASACTDFLDHPPKTALTQEGLYADLDNVELAVIGFMGRVRNTRVERDYCIFHLGTDEGQQGEYQVMTNADQAAMDYYNTRMAADNATLFRQWSDQRWPVLAQLMQTAYSLENYSGDEADRANQLLGEVCFWRAMVTFELCQYWGDIPILDMNQLPFHGTARRPVKDVYEFIISDLERAERYLPPTQTNRARPTSGIATALLGKVYLYAWEESDIRDYAKALTYFEQLTASGSRYSLVANYADLFDNSRSTFVQNSTESIYEFQFDVRQPFGNGPRAGIQWQTGSRPASGWGGNCVFGGYDLLMPTRYYFSMANEGGVWEEGDLRKDVSIRYDFVWTNPVTGTTHYPILDPLFGLDQLDPHSKKFEDHRIDGHDSFWASGKNVFYIRLADIWLCQAECLNELGRTPEAVAIVNDRIRARAWGGTLPAERAWNPGMSQSQFRTMILDERMRELGMEGWRRMDLIRTGTFVELIRERNRWAGEADAIKEHHMKFPIPLREIQENDDISANDQNPGYN